MKKIVWIIALVVLFVSFIPVVLVAEDDNLEKAGQAALAEREVTLTQMKEEIESFVLRAAKDQIVTKDEMVTLKNFFNNFVETKSRFNRELEVYSLETSVGLGEEYKKAIDAYFKGDILLKRDDNEEHTRRFFIEQTGVDVVIKEGRVVDWAVAPFIVWELILLLLTVGLFSYDSPWGILSGAGFIGLLILMLFG